MKINPNITLDDVKLVLQANGHAIHLCREAQQAPDDFSDDEWANIVHDLAAGKIDESGLDIDDDDYDE